MRKLKARWIFILIIGLLLSACYRDRGPAPVVNAWALPKAQQSQYRVQRGDTLYSIAWSFGLDYRALAAANGLRPPYRIKPGEYLRMIASSSRRRLKSSFGRRSPSSKKINHLHSAKKAKVHAVNNQWVNWPVPHWVWPAKGRITAGFSRTLSGNHGLNIAGHVGEPVRSAANGIVVYSGAGVLGYGNLIIIKHNNSFLSAYAFNKRILVKLGQRVTSGQRIALMGRNTAGKAMLHFEIRRNGKPVNPLHYLR